MTLVLLAIISIVVAIARRGRFSNMFKKPVKAWYLFVLALLLILVMRTGGALDITFLASISKWITFGAYLFILVGIIFNLDNLWMYVLLVGIMANFAVIFLNGGSMPVSVEALNAAGLGGADGTYMMSLSLTHHVAGASTVLPFLGGIIPIPIPVVGEVISLGTVLIGAAIFGIIQRMLVSKEELAAIDAMEAKEESSLLEKGVPSLGEAKASESVLIHDDDDFLIGNKDYVTEEIDIGDTSSFTNDDYEQVYASDEEDLNTMAEPSPAYEDAQESLLEDEKNEQEEMDQSYGGFNEALDGYDEDIERNNEEYFDYGEQDSQYAQDEFEESCVDDDLSQWAVSDEMPIPDIMQDDDATSAVSYDVDEFGIPIVSGAQALIMGEIPVSDSLPKGQTEILDFDEKNEAIDVKDHSALIDSNTVENVPNEPLSGRDADEPKWGDFSDKVEFAKADMDIPGVDIKGLEEEASSFDHGEVHVNVDEGENIDQNSKAQAIPEMDEDIIKASEKTDEIILDVKEDTSSILNENAKMPLDNMQIINDTTEPILDTKAASNVLKTVLSQENILPVEDAQIKVEEAAQEAVKDEKEVSVSSATDKMKETEHSAVNVAEKLQNVTDSKQAAKEVVSDAVQSQSQDENHVDIKNAAASVLENVKNVAQSAAEVGLKATGSTVEVNAATVGIAAGVLGVAAGAGIANAVSKNNEPKTIGVANIPLEAPKPLFEQQIIPEKNTLPLYQSPNLYSQAPIQQNTPQTFPQNSEYFNNQAISAGELGAAKTNNAPVFEQSFNPYTPPVSSVYNQSSPYAQSAYERNPLPVQNQVPQPEIPQTQIPQAKTPPVSLDNKALEGLYQSSLISQDDSNQAFNSTPEQSTNQETNSHAVENADSISKQKDMGDKDKEAESFKVPPITISLDEEAIQNEEESENQEAQIESEKPYTRTQKQENHSRVTVKRTGVSDSYAPSATPNSFNDVLSSENILNTDDEKEEDDEDFTFSNKALSEASEIIAYDEKMANKAREVKSAPSNIDTQRAYIVMDGRIVANPYYKFRRGSGINGSSMDGGVYRMNNGYLSQSDPFGMQRAQKERKEAKLQKSLEEIAPWNSDGDEPVQEVNQGKKQKKTSKEGYNKMEMNFGGIKFKFYNNEEDDDE